MRFTSQTTGTGTRLFYAPRYGWSTFVAFSLGRPRELDTNSQTPLAGAGYSNQTA